MVLNNILKRRRYLTDQDCIIFWRFSEDKPKKLRKKVNFVERLVVPHNINVPNHVDGSYNVNVKNFYTIIYDFNTILLFFLVTLIVIKIILVYNINTNIGSHGKFLIFK
jgi:hypothetical protein